MKRKRPRGYDEREVATILERAADLHGAALVPAIGGRSLDEIKLIAREVGVDASAVEAAADSLVQDHADRWPLVGRPPRMELTASVHGVLDDEGTGQLLATLQRALDAKGRATVGPGSLELRRLGVLGREMVVVTARKGRTHIEARGRYRRGFVASFAAGGLAGGLASVGLLELLHLVPFLGDWAVPLVLGSALAAGRGVWGWFSGLKERGLRRLVERSAEVVEEEEAPAPEGRLLP
jgi:hypothetical protein